MSEEISYLSAFGVDVITAFDLVDCSDINELIGKEDAVDSE